MYMQLQACVYMIYIQKSKQCFCFNSYGGNSWEICTDLYCSLSNLVQYIWTPLLFNNISFKNLWRLVIEFICINGMFLSYFKMKTTLMWLKGCLAVRRERTKTMIHHQDKGTMNQHHMKILKVRLIFTRLL